MKKISNVKEYFIFVEDEIFNKDLVGVMFEINYVVDLLVIDIRFWLMKFLIYIFFV